MCGWEWTRGGLPSFGDRLAHRRQTGSLRNGKRGRLRYGFRPDADAGFFVDVGAAVFAGAGAEVFVGFRLACFACAVSLPKVTPRFSSTVPVASQSCVMLLFNSA